MLAAAPTSPATSSSIDRAPESISASVALAPLEPELHLSLTNGLARTEVLALTALEHAAVVDPETLTARNELIGHRVRVR